MNVSNIHLSYSLCFSEPVLFPFSYKSKNSLIRNNRIVLSKPCVELPVVQMVKNCLQFRKDLGSIPRVGRSPGGGNGNPLQYSCLENPIDRGSWWNMVQRGFKDSEMTKELETTKWSSIHTNKSGILFVCFNNTRTWHYLF